MIALETRGSVAVKSNNRSVKSWATMAGIIAAQLGELLSGGCEILDALSIVA